MGLLHAVGRNRLLEALPEDVFARMKGALEKVSFDIQTILYGADNVIDYVFFPSAVSCRWSSRWRTAPPSRSAPSETKAWWALQCSSAWSAVRPRRSARSPGIACGCQPAAFKKELAEEDRILHQLVSKYAQAMINHISQSVACNHLHSVEERTCRWLLMMHDRVGKNDFLLTQEFIAQMLGVRQSSVTVATGLLERAGLITYKRGRITVLDRERLEQASCECYNVVRLEYDRLLEKNSRTS